MKPQPTVCPEIRGAGVDLPVLLGDELDLCDKRGERFFKRAEAVAILPSVTSAAERCLKPHVSLCGELAPPLVFSTIFYHLIVNVGFSITRIGNFRNQKGQFWPNKPTNS